MHFLFLPLLCFQSNAKCKIGKRIGAKKWSKELRSTEDTSTNPFSYHWPVDGFVDNVVFQLGPCVDLDQIGFEAILPL